MKYNNRLNHRKRKKFIFRVWFIAFACFLALVGGLGYFIYDFIKTQTSDSGETATSVAINTTVASSQNIFRTQFFQFQADKNWVEVTSESTPNKYVYRSIRNSLIEHELNIYVNQIPANLKSNRILPVTYEANSALKATQVLEHCSKMVPGSKLGAPQVLMGNVRFSCDADTSNYTVLAGLVGGDSRLNLVRPNKTTMSYSIYYSNLKATPDGNEITSIVNTFQSL